MSQAAGEYVMNPAEDTVLYGDQLVEGMWVLPDDPQRRTPSGEREDQQIRRQRFRRVTRLRHTLAATAVQPAQMTFVGEWVDGYQHAWEGAVTRAWIVKKDAAVERARRDPREAGG